jgi:hypothetical protein
MVKELSTNRKVAVSITDEAIFKIYLILLVAIDPGIYSASNRSVHHKHKTNYFSGE